MRVCLRFRTVPALPAGAIWSDFFVLEGGGFFSISLLLDIIADNYTHMAAVCLYSSFPAWLLRSPCWFRRAYACLSVLRIRTYRPSQTLLYQSVGRRLARRARTNCVWLGNGGMTLFAAYVRHRALPADGSMPLNTFALRVGLHRTAASVPRRISYFQHAAARASHDDVLPGLNPATLCALSLAFAFRLAAADHACVCRICLAWTLYADAPPVRNHHAVEITTPRVGGFLTGSATVSCWRALLRATASITCRYCPPYYYTA